MADMPSPEGEPNQQLLEGKPEQEPVPYYHAARFRNEGPARRAYFQAQELLLTPRMLTSQRIAFFSSKSGTLPSLVSRHLKT
jgi:hypothetical protein